MTERDPWEERANCKGVDPNVFFPERKLGRPHPLFEKPAKAYCRGCEVRLQCLLAALERNEPDGVWGGFNTRERKELRRQRRLSKQPYESLIKHLERRDTAS